MNNQLLRAYGAVMLATTNGGRDKYWSAFKLRGTPPRVKRAGEFVYRDGMRGRLNTRRVQGFVG